MEFSVKKIKSIQFSLCKKLNSEKREDQFYVLPNRFPEELFRKVNKFGRAVPSAVYLSKEERETYKITIENGLVLNSKKELLDTRAENRALGDGYKSFLLVMDRDGKIYAAPRRIKSFLEKTKSFADLEREVFICCGKLTKKGEEKDCIWMESNNEIWEYGIETEKTTIFSRSEFYENYNPKEIEKCNRNELLIRKGIVKQDKFSVVLCPSEIKHSSIIQGEPAAFAGELECVEGKIVSITDRSGHYQPPKEFTKIFIDNLKKLNADLNNCKIELTLEENNDLKNFLNKINFKDKNEQNTLGKQI
jgi:hypothetical protein